MNVLALCFQTDDGEADGCGLVLAGTSGVIWSLPLNSTGRAKTADAMVSIKMDKDRHLSFTLTVLLPRLSRSTLFVDSNRLYLVFHPVSLYPAPDSVSLLYPTSPLTPHTAFRL